MIAQKRSKSKPAKKAELLYAKGAYLAFVDPDADEEMAFKLGKVLKAVKDSEEEFKCCIYKQDKATEFSKDIKSAMVLEQTVVKEVTVKEDGDKLTLTRP